MDLLNKCRKNVIELKDIPANPTYDKVLEGIELYRKKI